ncbi:MAG: hypothetical protein NWT00_09915 [Beijerinckiaceae bacterium]|nr:hypothetical protein [Beijerinckiaceae bacterium]
MSGPDPGITAIPECAPAFTMGMAKDTTAFLAEGVRFEFFNGDDLFFY